MSDDRLFRTPTAYSANIRLAENGWWTLRIDTLYEGEPWSIDDRVVYERLSLAECADCLLGELFTART
jgi:hypothetical protein